MKQASLPLVVDSDPAIENGVVFDAGTIDRVERTDSGFLRAPARITRVGVFVYRLADGTTRRELRPAEEVFAADSLRTLALVPLTREHPEPLGTAVTVDNRKALDVGVVDSDARAEGDYIAATVQIEDAAAISDAESGKRRELSAGYNRQLDRTPGVWNGIPYDAVQRRIRYNHVALVASGRAGPDARIRIDSQAAVMVCDASEDKTPQPEIQNMKRKLTVKGIPYELDCEDSAFAAITQALEEGTAKITSLDSKLAETTKAAETLRARADTAESELKKSQALVVDSTKPEKIQELVKARLTLERAVKPLLTVDGKEPDLTALTDDEIKRKVVLVADAEAKLEGVTVDYLEGRYQGALKALTASSAGRASTANRQLRVATGTQPGGQAAQTVVVDVAEAKRKLREETENAWQKPIGGAAAAQ